MRLSQRSRLALFLGSALAALLWAAAIASSQSALSVSGRVVNESGQPVVGARVRVKATANLTLSDETGAFTLSGIAEGQSVVITAWQEGYLVGYAQVVSPATDLVIHLKKHYTTDNAYYSWHSSSGPIEEIGCIHCMVAYPQWVEDAHAQSATNPRFFSMYNGRSFSGAVAAPGYKLDFPGTAGNCATCHAPAAAVRGKQYFATADMNQLQGVEKEGVFCEFCHKVGSVYLNPQTGRPYENAPGVVSMRLFRPPTGGAEQLFFGPYDDVTRRVAYSPLQKRSEFCAPCHQFSFWGTPIYESFAEWQASAYAAQGVQCQACHMRPTDLHYFVFPERGGLTREYATAANHRMPGAADLTLLQNTVALTVTMTISEAQMIADVTLYNALAGHHVPTDFPGRQMLLVIAASDAQGQPLALLAGPTLPEWAGMGDSADDYGGKPGKGYAKLLKDVLSGESPVVSYWKQTLIVADTRLPALTADHSRYVFQLPASGAGQVTARVLLRRLFIAEARQKEWDIPDLEMARVVVNAVNGPATISYWPDPSQVFDPPISTTIMDRKPTIKIQESMPEKPLAVAELPANWRRAASALALTPDGRTLLAVNPDSGTLSLIDTESRTVLAELAVGWQPQTVAVDKVGRLAVVACRESGDIALVSVQARSVVARVAVGSEPASALLSADSRLAYVTLTGRDELALVDIAARQVIARLPLEADPYGLALLADDQTLLVSHLRSGRVSVVQRLPWNRVYLPLLLKMGGALPVIPGSGTTESRWRLSLVKVISAWPDGNLSQRIIPSLDGKRAYLPQTRSNTANRALTFDTTLFPIVAVLNLERLEMVARENIALDIADEPVGLPTDAALAADTGLLWVINSASNDISVISPATRTKMAHIKVQDNPQGIVLSPDGLLAYVNNVLAGTISVISTRSYQVLATVESTQMPLPPALLHGKRLFFSSDNRDGEKMARQQWISCNSCHFDGEQDGRTWFFGFAGPRNTTSLRGMIETYPLRWSGEWDESADSEFAIRREQFGQGLIPGEMYPTLGAYNQGRSYDLDALSLYIDQLALRPSPYPFDAAAQRGQAIFQRADTQCASCHPAPLYTDLKKHDVGTSTPDERIGPRFDTPTLKGLWNSAPYLHDGSAATLYDVLKARNPADLHGVTSQLSAQELNDLIAFMLALPR